MAASLQSSFTALSSAPKPSRGRSRRSQISCSGCSIDRRNMLQVLGGLYGASSSLGHKAEALPILPPDLRTCDPTGATTTRRVGDKQEVVKLDVNCCPPFTDKQGDYKLRVFTLRVTKTVKFLVPKPAKGKEDEALVLENIVTDNSQLIKFDVFINDEDDNPDELDRAEYVGSFTSCRTGLRGRRV